jgi:hypothetical protein
LRIGGARNGATQGKRGFFLLLINEGDGRKEEKRSAKKGGNRKMTNEIPRTRPDAVWKI